jgi:hypothetical protein
VPSLKVLRHLSICACTWCSLTGSRPVNFAAVWQTSTSSVTRYYGSPCLPEEVPGRSQILFVDKRRQVAPSTREIVSLILRTESPNTRKVISVSSLCSGTFKEGTETPAVLPGHQYCKSRLFAPFYDGYNEKGQEIYTYMSWKCATSRGNAYTRPDGTVGVSERSFPKRLRVFVYTCMYASIALRSVI